MTDRRIVATIWPASESEKKLKKILPHIAIARMNMSHGSHAEHLNKINLIREIDSETKILVDLQWPKIRLWKFINGREDFRKWDRTHLIYDKAKLDNCDRTHLYVTFEQVIKDLKAWDIILFNDWYMSAKVIEKRSDDNRLYIEMLNSWILSSNKWVNSSTASLSIDSLTEKDLKDLEFWLKQNPDYIAISFVRSADDVINLKSLIDKAWSKAKIIVKIERHEAIKNLEEIAKETDVIMIARWDLWIEVDLKELPKLQEYCIEVWKKYGKPVIWATQVLESMVNFPLPTRAEVTDIYTAIKSWADYTMLSAESATGLYVKEAINFMADMWKKYWK